MCSKGLFLYLELEVSSPTNEEQLSKECEGTSEPPIIIDFISAEQQQTDMDPIKGECIFCSMHLSTHE